MRYEKGCFIFLFLATFSVQSGYASDKAIGAIARSEGRVEIIRTSGEVVLARLSEMVQVGDRIRTKSYSKVKINLRDKSEVMLASNTCVEITEYTLGVHNKRETGKITLTRGRVRARVSKTGLPDTFAILTPNACGTVKGSDIFASYQSGKTAMLVKEGSLVLFNLLIPDQLLKVGVGDTALVSFHKPPAELRPYFDAELRHYEKDVEPVATVHRMGRGAEASEMNGTVVSVNGKARLFKSGSTKWHYLKRNESLAAGDRILTEGNGKIEMRLDNGDLIVLLPDTELVFAQPQLDVATGGKINVFESIKGKIKAIINTGKKSSFEVRTPTAVCGVRGTVMIIDIQPSGTTVYYEGGGGVMTSLVTGKTILLESGQHSSIDMEGILSSPVYTTDEQRWDLNEAYRMTPVEKGIVTQAGDTGAAKVSLAAETKTDTASSGPAQTDKSESSILTQLFDQIVLQTVLPSPVSGSSDTIFSGIFGYVGTAGSRAVLTGSGGSVDATLDFAPVWGSSATAGSISGTYSSQPSGSYLITADLECTASDSGRYKGFFRGLMRGGIFRMATACIYIDSSNRGGTMSSDIAGTYTASTLTASDPAAIMATDQGLTSISRESFFSTPMDSLELAGRGIGNFNGGDDIVCGSIGTTDGFSGSALNITGQNWGIVEFSSQGTMTGPTTNNTWKLALGGESQFINADKSFWVSTVNGQEGSSGRLYGFFDGVWLSKTNDNPLDDGVCAGPLSEGTLIGDYDSAGLTWEATGTAEWSQWTSLFTQANLGFTITQLASFVNYPISEVTARAVTLAGGSDSSFNSASAVVRLYDNFQAGAINLWTAVIDDGQFSGSGPATPTSWTLNLSGAATALTLNGDKWDNNTWHATVTGNLPPPATIVNAGEASGTYSTSSGEFKGVAVGTW